MQSIIPKCALVLLICALANVSYAQSDVTQVNGLIQEGRKDEFLGSYQNAVPKYRNALMLQLSDSAFDESQILATLNLYGESYSHIGLFSIPQDRDKDEKLLRAMAEYTVQKKNAQMAQMIHGLLLFFGEQKFGIPRRGIQYSYLRADPLKPTCTLEKPLPRIESINNISDLTVCQQQHAFFKLVNSAITPEVKVYRQFEIDFFDSAVRPSL